MSHNAATVDEFLGALTTAPPWAQAAMALFAVAVVASVLAPWWRRRRARAAFATLAGTAPVKTLDWVTASFQADVAGRPVEVRREWRSRRSSAGQVTYRGPIGHTLVTSMPLSGSRWELHQVDIASMRTAARRAGDLTSGDAAFDARFRVRQDGVPVRDAWLDAPTRAAVTALFDTPGVTGPVWVEGQQLQVLRPEPWSDLDPPALRRLLEAQAALASALERTAGWRGPQV